MAAGSPEEPYAEQAEPQRQQRFFRSGLDETVEFDATDEGFTQNFAKTKDDLDVPAFLRKQMD